MGRLSDQKVRLYAGLFGYLVSWILEADGRLCPRADWKPPIGVRRFETDWLRASGAFST